MTQKERLLETLEHRGLAGVKVYEIVSPRPKGLGIAQYNARILELRREGHDIVNKEPGHFVLVNEGQQEMFDGKVSENEGPQL